MTPLAGAIAIASVLALPAASTGTAQRPAPQKPPSKPAQPSPIKPRVAPKKPSEPRLFIHVNGGVQATTTDFRTTVPFRLFTDPTEEAQFEAGYGIEAGPLVDVRGGALIHRRLGVAVGMTRFTETGGATVRARLPHPFFLDRPREISGDTGGFRREELAIHFQATYAIPVRRRIVATMFGGPSVFNVRQDLVERVQFSEEYPYDTATFTGAPKRRGKDARIGFNVGMDIAHFFTRHVGVGGVVRFSRASMQMDIAEGRTQNVDAGGLHLGGGVRLAF